MQRTTVHSPYKWQVTADTWSSTKAKAILSTLPPTPLPTKGPLHALLATTRRSLPSTFSIRRQDAQEAVDTGAVLVLGQIAHWLQQSPCLELQGPLQEGCTESGMWHLVTNTLANAIVTLDLETGKDPHTCSFIKQLEASGKLYPKEGLGMNVYPDSNGYVATAIMQRAVLIWL